MKVKAMEGDNSLIFIGGLIDGRGGYAERTIIEIRGDRIVRIESSGEAKVNSECVDVGSLTIMPGLIDAHVHLWGVRTMDYFHRLVVPEEMNLLRATSDLNKLIDPGYTSIRDAGSREELEDILKP
jgi:imidazolonepropionase-like amidohydrolase